MRPVKQGRFKYWTSPVFFEKPYAMMLSRYAMPHWLNRAVLRMLAQRTMFKSYWPKKFGDHIPTENLQILNLNQYICQTFRFFRLSPICVLSLSKEAGLGMHGCRSADLNHSPLCLQDLIRRCQIADLLIFSAHRISNFRISITWYANFSQTE